MKRDGIETALGACAYCGSNEHSTPEHAEFISLARARGTIVLGGDVTLEDRMLGRHGPLTPEQAADMKRFYDHAEAVITETAASVKAELIENLTAIDPDTDWYAISNGLSVVMPCGTLINGGDE